jgi:hypothetical protein
VGVPCLHLQSITLVSWLKATHQKAGRQVPLHDVLHGRLSAQHPAEKLRCAAAYREEYGENEYGGLPVSARTAVPVSTSSPLACHGEALAIDVSRGIDADGVVDVLDRLALTQGPPHYVRFDNGPEFVAHAVRDWCRFNGAGSLFIDPGSPWQNAWIVMNCSTRGASTRCWKPA